MARRTRSWMLTGPAQQPGARIRVKHGSAIPGVLARDGDGARRGGRRALHADGPSQGQGFDARPVRGPRAPYEVDAIGKGHPQRRGGVSDRAGVGTSDGHPAFWLPRTWDEQVVATGRRVRVVPQSERPGALGTRCAQPLLRAGERVRALPSDDARGRKPPRERGGGAKDARGGPRAEGSRPPNGLSQQRLTGRNPYGGGHPRRLRCDPWTRKCRCEGTRSASTRTWAARARRARRTELAPLRNIV